MTHENDSDTLARDETSDMIASDKVEGTTVYNQSGDRLGTVKHFMVGKRDGKVRYAVMSFGGFLGMGNRYYPLPWNALTYDDRQGGYVVNLTRDQIEQAPSYEDGQEPTYDRSYGQRVYGYYGFAY
ncbi:PRC-barrel domain containing protein [Sphingomonas parva]|uniref:PRC-barrel domain containing protein n=1 Tax=Sphingomonas parva TaxID=2555898 RepID=A0A4Y8ZQ07_9SPHN|nr:PRC-barrel domain-containing protein [Sphingomonas parva]TFI57547.1 PRC-barrel domain containing protein [Sphingomonas parva]